MKTFLSPMESAPPSLYSLALLDDSFQKKDVFDPKKIIRLATSVFSYCTDNLRPEMIWFLIRHDFH